MVRRHAKAGDFSGLDKLMDVNAVDSSGGSALIYAAKWNKLPVAKKLVEEINFLAHPGSGEKAEIDISDVIGNSIQVTTNSHKNVAIIEEQYQHKQNTVSEAHKLRGENRHRDKNSDEESQHKYLGRIFKYA